MKANNALTALRLAANCLDVAYQVAQEDNDASKAYAEKLAREALTHTVDAIGFLSGRATRHAETQVPPPDADAEVFRCDDCAAPQYACRCIEECERCGSSGSSKRLAERQFFNDPARFLLCDDCNKFLRSEAGKEELDVSFLGDEECDSCGTLRSKHATDPGACGTFRTKGDSE